MSLWKVKATLIQNLKICVQTLAPLWTGSVTLNKSHQFSQFFFFFTKRKLYILNCKYESGETQLKQKTLLFTVLLYLDHQIQYLYFSPILIFYNSYLAPLTVLDWSILYWVHCYSDRLKRIKGPLPKESIYIIFNKCINATNSHQLLTMLQKPF